MAREKRLQIRLTEREFSALELYASHKGVSMSEIIRDFVKSLMTSTQEQPSVGTAHHSESKPT